MLHCRVRVLRGGAGGLEISPPLGQCAPDLQILQVSEWLLEIDQVIPASKQVSQIPPSGIRNKGCRNNLQVGIDLFCCLFFWNSLRLASFRVKRRCGRTVDRRYLANGREATAGEAKSEHSAAAEAAPPQRSHRSWRRRLEKARDGSDRIAARHHGRTHTHVAAGPAARRLHHGALMSARRTVLWVIVAFILGLGVAFVWLAASRRSSPITLSLVRLRNENTNGPEAIIHFTNESTDRLRWELQTFVMSNGAWVSAPTQPRVDHAAAVLRSHQSWNHAVPAPSGAMRWKVELRSQRRDTVLEDQVERLFKLARLSSPVGSDSRRTKFTNELIFDR